MNSVLDQITNYLQLPNGIGTAGQPTEEQLAAVKEAGYQVVINLRPNVPEALQNEDRIVLALGMEYLHIPVKWDAPTLEDVRRFFDIMRARKEKKVFIHCAMNKRVAAFVYLYRIIEQNVAQEVAAHDLYRIWTPNPVWQRLINQVREQYESPHVILATKQPLKKPDGIPHRPVLTTGRN